MNSPYDLSSGRKGFRALTDMARSSQYALSARHIRSVNAAYDQMDSNVIKSNQCAGELERKVLKLK